MKQIIVVIIYIFMIISYSFNQKYVYIENANVFELIYVVDRKKLYSKKKNNEFKSKRARFIKKYIKRIVYEISKYISFKSYNKINVMVYKE